MDFEKAKLNPAAVFKSPQEVVSSQELSRQQKIEILRRWDQDPNLFVSDLTKSSELGE